MLSLIEIKKYFINVDMELIIIIIPNATRHRMLIVKFVSNPID